MDLRHARTFVTVAELGTVSKAALRLRIAQPALSRQISALEQELGLKLFDRIGRRLLLTGEGQQLLGDCRSLLNCASAIGEHARLLQRGDAGVLKVGASPQHIESVQSAFLYRYSLRFPNVQVQLIEAAGQDTMAMLERREIDLGQNLAPILGPDDHRFGSVPLQHVDLLAACHPSSSLEAAAGQDPPSRSAVWYLSLCFCLRRISYFAEYLTLPADLPTSSRIFLSKAAPRIRCWRWPKPGTAWRSFPRSCRRAIISCASPP